MGGRLAFDLEEISHDPQSLDEGGFWAVTTTFEGEWTCARFRTIINSNFPFSNSQWQGISGEWESTFSQSDYENCVDQIREEISQGSVYQVNACRELSAQLSQEPLVGLMAQLLKSNPAPYASYLKLPKIEIVSASPELFFELKDRGVRSGPIKGTQTLDFAGGEKDFGSKDIAENIMIVDLIRNDLGRICETGSISVPQLLKIQDHPGLSHLVSFIEGRIRLGISWVDISAALLPPGSVSGAPKLSAVSTIKKLEARDRGPYCGALGWVENDSALLSVAIRIFWNNGDGLLRFGTGAGITWSSDARQEWLETELKAARLISIAQGRKSSTW